MGSITPLKGGPYDLCPEDYAPPVPPLAEREYKSWSFVYPDVPAAPGPCEYRSRPAANVWQNSGEMCGILLVSRCWPDEMLFSPPFGRCSHGHDGDGLYPFVDPHKAGPMEKRTANSTHSPRSDTCAPGQRMSLLVKKNIAFDPPYITLLCLQRVMFQTHYLSYLFQQLFLWFFFFHFFSPLLKSLFFSLAPGVLMYKQNMYHLDTKEFFMEISRNLSRYHHHFHDIPNFFPISPLYAAVSEKRRGIHPCPGFRQCIFRRIRSSAFSYKTTV